MKRISVDEQVADKLIKKAQENIPEEVPEYDAAEQNKPTQYSIPTGNAQLVYGIEGKEGEEFDVPREGTMLPPGTYRVVSHQADAEHSGPWGSFSNLTVERTGDAETEGHLSVGL
jgi:hypothetical protein